jgi:hypothetical protein
MKPHGPHQALRRDLELVGLAWLILILDLVLDGRPNVAVGVILTLPLLAYLWSGHMPGRGGVVGCVVLALGAITIPPEPGSWAWGDLALLWALSVTAVLGGIWAQHGVALRQELKGSRGREIGLIQDFESATVPPPNLARLTVWVGSETSGRRLSYHAGEPVGFQRPWCRPVPTPRRQADD